MLIDVLFLVLMSPWLTRVLLRLLGIEAQALHDLFEDLCPCGVTP